MSNLEDPDFNFDRFGSGIRTHQDVEYLDLTLFDIKFIPAVFPAHIHHYHENGGVMSAPFCHKSSLVLSNDGVEKLLSEPGVHYLMYVYRARSAQDGIWVRSYNFKAGTPQCDFSVDKPKTMQEWLTLWGRDVDLIKYPHTCPRCSNPAYIGFNLVDCSRNCH